MGSQGILKSVDAGGSRAQGVGCTDDSSLLTAGAGPIGEKLRHVAGTAATGITSGGITQMDEANRRGDHELADTTLFALARYLVGRADLSELEAEIATAVLDWYAHLAKTYT